MVVGLPFCRWDVSDGFEKPAVVEPVHVFEGGVLDLVEVLPRSAFVDEFCLVQTNDGFGEGVIVRIPNRADRWFDAGYGEPVRVTNGQILGGFKRSSQRLESEELQWKQGRFVGLIVRCGRRCGRLVVRRLGGVSIGSGFGKGSLVGCRARMPVWRLVCRLRLVRVGSARMAGWSHFLLSLFGGAICLLLSEKEIAVLHARDCGVREIARRLGRCASTISRELGRNAATRSGGLEYRATTAQWHSDRRACRPKVAKLAWERQASPVRPRSSRWRYRPPRW